jgi:nitrate reductase NapE component
MADMLAKMLLSTLIAFVVIVMGIWVLLSIVFALSKEGGNGGSTKDKNFDLF